ncbi:MAG TPA: response regulator [Kofleriaceae bacterium]|nr:response regulator [Kofleriaceae bacterium]
MKRILLMDDSPIFLAVARHALETAGYEVITASDLETFQQARQQKPADLVLMDVQMPEAFGDDIAMTLRFAHDVDTPIYLLSSLDDKDLAERANEAQIDGYISKNIGMDAIVDEVRRILGPGLTPA